MDPQTIQLYSSAFATIIGLVCNYRQENAANDSLSAANFIAWLADHRHESAKQMLESNQKLLESLVPIIQADQELFAQKFDVLNSTLAQILSRIDVFSSAANAFAPNKELSSQAFEILQILVESRGNELVLIYQMGGLPPMLEVMGICSINYDEPRFVEDDLDTLCSMGFLTQRTEQGIFYYRLTRSGLSFIQNSVGGQG